MRPIRHKQSPETSTEAAAVDTPPNHWRVKLRRHWPLVVLFFVTLVVQIAMYKHSEPNVFPDSGAYAALGKVGWNNPGHMSFRTPGYPVFVNLHFRLFGEQAWRTIMTTQYVLGTFVPVLLYVLFLALVRRPGVAALGAGGWLLDRYSVQLPIVPLTEYLSAVLLVASLAAFVWALSAKRWWTAAATGIVFYLMGIVRPSFSLLPYFLVAGALGVELLYPHLRSSWKRSAAWYAVILVVFQLGMFTRCWAVYRHTGYFTLSHQMGINLTNHVGKYMELAPDEFAQIRDIYLRQRAAQKGSHINVHDMVDWQAETKRPLWEVSREFGRLSKYLIWKYPDRYFAGVRDNWEKIWTDSPFYVTDIYDPESRRRGPTSVFDFIRKSDFFRPIYGNIEELVWAKKNRLLLVPYVLLFACALVVYLVRKTPQAVIAMVAITGAVFYHVIIHILVQATEFGRYKLPVQGLWFSTLVLMHVWAIAAGVQRIQTYFASSTTSDAPKKYGGRLLLRARASA